MHLIEPRQERSARTLEALLVAADEVLRQRSPRGASIAEICRRAGVTSGAFYGRFGGKADLYAMLERRVYEDFEEELIDRIGRQHEERPLGGVLAAVIAAVSSSYRRHAGGIRALGELARSDTALAKRMERFNRRVFDRVIEWLEGSGAAWTHEDPRAALRRILSWVTVVKRQRIVFEELGLRGVGPEATEDRELVRMAARYLTAESREELA